MFTPGDMTSAFCDVLSLLEILFAPSLQTSQIPSIYSLSMLIVFSRIICIPRLACSQWWSESQYIWSPFNLKFSKRDDTLNNPLDIYVLTFFLPVFLFILKHSNVKLHLFYYIGLKKETIITFFLSLRIDFLTLFSFIVCPDYDFPSRCFSHFLTISPHIWISPLLASH